MLKFGTDGWRGIIADDFTFAHVRLVSKSIACYLTDHFSEPKLLVGYDSRFLSPQFAQTVAEVLAANGVKVFFANSFAPTPVFSAYVAHNGLDGAIIITASHNPAKFNGLKFKTSNGQSAGLEITKRFEENIVKLKQYPVEQISFKQGVEEGVIEVIDPLPAYFKLLQKFINVDLSNLKVVIDPLYGAGQKVFADFLSSQGAAVKEIHNIRDADFGGLHPEPIEPHINDLKQAVVNEQADLGLAFDGDGDRLGAVAENGAFVNAHQIFALLLKYLVEEMKLTGTVVKTVSTTRMIDCLADKYGLPLVETPIGFKYIAQQFQDKDVLIGGEESGGLAVKNHLPERDGLLSGLLLLQAVVKAKKPLSKLIKELASLACPSFYGRRDLPFAIDNKERLAAFLRQNNLFKTKVQEVKTFDGFKFIFFDGSWLMIRPSGTEPVTRVYAEALNGQQLAELLTQGEDLVKKFKEKKV